MILALSPDSSSLCRLGSYKACKSVECNPTAGISFSFCPDSERVSNTYFKQSTFPHCFKIRPFQFSLLWFSLGLGFTRDTHLSTPMFFIWVIWLGVPNPQRDIWQVWSPLLFAMIGERLLHWHLLIRERPKTLLNILQSTEQLLHHKHTQQRII